MSRPFLDGLAARGIQEAEILLVENGSTDATYETCLVLEKRFPGAVRALRVPEASYGEAVRRGIPAASGEAVFVLECDALDPDFVVRALDAIGRDETDFVVGSKRHPESVDARPWARRLSTRLFNFALKVLFAFPGTDTHGFKAMRADVARELVEKSVTSGESLQTELVLLAYRLGYRVSEAPVRLRETRATPIPVFRRLPKVLKIVREIRSSLARFPEPGRGPRRGPTPLIGRLIVGDLFLQMVLYPAYLLTRAKPFYYVFMALFVVLLGLLAWALVKGIARRPWLLIPILLLVAVRLPFYLVPDGLITSSDNALEALQAREIQATHTAPFYLLESLHHQGTWKYLLIANLWDFFGRGYIWVLLLQLLFFGAFLYLFFEAFKTAFDPGVLLVVVRGPVRVRRGALRLFAGHPRRTLPGDGRAFSPGRRAVRFRFREARPADPGLFLHDLACLPASAGRGLRGLVRRDRRDPGPRPPEIRPQPVGPGRRRGGGTCHAGRLPDCFSRREPGIAKGFETIKIGLPGQAVFAELPGRLTAVFTSLFRHEFAYFLKFFKDGGGGRVLDIVNWGVVGLSLIVLVAALGLAIRDIVAALRRKAAPLAARWADIFMLFLFAAFLAKTLCLAPFREEPRHNFDLLILVLLAYAKVLSRLAGVFRRMTFRSVAAAGLLLALAAPHYGYFLKAARRKNACYHGLMATLADRKVEFLTGDFGIVYVVHFLSDGRILVSDSIGPMTVPCFYPGMRDLVDRVPDNKKAIFIFSRKYSLSAWRGWKTVPLRKKINEDIRTRHLRYERFLTDDYLLLVPKPALTRKAKASKKTPPDKIPDG